MAGMVQGAFRQVLAGIDVITSLAGVTIIFLQSIMY
jgi:hypothetical protein